MMTIRELDAVADLAAVTQFYADAPDYWELAESKPPDAAKAADFFTDGPPGCDPTQAYHLGLFLGDRISGLGELSFGFPDPNDAYLGFMMLGPWARGNGYGQTFFAHTEALAKARGANALYLGVMESNPRGRAFWEGEGFKPTGKSGTMQVGVREQTLHRLFKPL